MPLSRDLNQFAAFAGFVAVLVGFTSSVAIVFQAALVFVATPEVIVSWMWALGLCSVMPSLILKQPVMVAWSTPGAAVLATAALITFLVTLSGVAIASIGSAFWGVMAGAIALFVQQARGHKTIDP